jgi:Arc/MetJ-type ribon-helix-helix transcriptional regulator
MTIELSSDLEQIVKAKVASGIYPNADEFIRPAILQCERLQKSRLDDAIAIGIEQADRGEFSERTVEDIIRHKERQKPKEKLKDKSITTKSACQNTFSPQKRIAISKRFGITPTNNGDESRPVPSSLS